MRLEFDIAGSGSPLLFLHGGFTTRRVFGYQLLHLSRRHTVITPDLPGYGNSPWDPERPWFDQAVNAAVDLATSLEVEAPLVIGWSLGGLVAREVVDQLDGARLILVGTSRTGIDEETRGAMQKQMTADFPRYARTMVRSFTSSAVSPDTEDWLQDMALATGVNVALASVVHTSVPLRYPLPAGTLSISGSRDQIIAPSSRVVEDVEQILFEQSGHAPFLEEKTQFNELIAEVAAR